MTQQDFSEYVEQDSPPTDKPQHYEIRLGLAPRMPIDELVKWLQEMFKTPELSGGVVTLVEGGIPEDCQTLPNP